MKTNKINIGILAHVDAGKTTLSESLLYQTGKIKKLGRVDHKDAYLDTFELEKARGITIFSKQAVFPLKDYEVTLLDTPGHVDFSAEMERVLRVLDYAILVINGSDGVQGHTTTVWKLLKRYNVPTFIFVNKMDLVSANKESLLAELKNKVDDNCVDFCRPDEEQRLDELAVCDELMMEQYLDSGEIEKEALQNAIARRKVFPMYFGSALKNKGVKAFLDGLGDYMIPKSYPDIFGARVFKVTRNQQGERLTHIKITGGSLKVKTLLTNKNQKNIEIEEELQQVWSEKVDQIRIYSGAGYETVQEVEAGSICTVTGLSMTRPGDGLGFENQGDAPALTPVLSYKVDFEKGTNVYTMLKNLRILEEEEPHLNVLWNEVLGEIHVQVMGEIQIEILKSTILERFGVKVSFDKGNLVYRESIQSSVIGVGHFEPLRHYAEVHLLLEPLDIGQGMIFTSNCSEDMMDRNWQRLVLSHLNERQHIGVLTGSVLTNMKITLVAGRGHNKHTEGGDFRQATFRALRQGLMKAESVLLEPFYSYTLELPREMLGKAIADMERLYGRYDDPVIEGEHAMLKGVAPVATMMNYGTEVIAYTKGQGRLSLNFKGYEPCHNQEEVIEQIGYNPEQDVDHPAGSVFCSKGSGYSVPWQEADSHMHVDSGIRLGEAKASSSQPLKHVERAQTRASYTEEELEAIFVKTYGERKERRVSGNSRVFSNKKNNTGAINTNVDTNNQGSKYLKKQTKKKEESYLLVDGYNIIFCWEDLKVLAEENLDTARLRLMDILCNYQGQTGEIVILVFDAYRVAGNRGDISTYNNINVVYTKEAETADQYIEKFVHTVRPKYEVTVATSDIVEQVIILGKGARKISAEGFKAEVDSLNKVIQERYIGHKVSEKNRPFDKVLKEKFRSKE